MAQPIFWIYIGDASFVPRTIGGAPDPKDWEEVPGSPDGFLHSRVPGPDDTAEIAALTARLRAAGVGGVDQIRVNNPMSADGSPGMVRVWRVQ